MRRKGFVVALSGVDCAGKSTQRDLLVSALRARGRSLVTVYARPGYTPGLRLVKRGLRGLGAMRKRSRGDAAAAPSTFPRRAANLGHPLRRRLWLAAAQLDLLVLALRIRLWRARGRIVVCNRYLLDALVDFRVNFPDERVEERLLWRLLRRCLPRPEASFCLLIPSGEAGERMQRKGRFHRETPEVLEQRWRAYQALSEDLGVQVLDGERPVAEIARAIQERVSAALVPDQVLAATTDRLPRNAASLPGPDADVRDWPLRAQE